MSFSDKVVIITGASSGIGADAARHLAKLGAHVAIVGRNASRLNAVAEEIRKAESPAPLVIVADVNVDAERILNETINHFGYLNVLVNNAGIVLPEVGGFETLDMTDFDRQLNTNLRSAVKLTKLAVPHLAKTKGNVVNISSTSGLRPCANLMAYCISKSGLDQFTKFAALELAPKGIRVNALNPGWIKTPIIHTSFGVSADGADAFFKEALKSYPLGRVGEVSDTSAAIAYLSSANASFVTGVLLPVDGGEMLSFTD